MYKKTFAALQSDDAFTLLEMLFAFSIFTIIIFFVSPILSLMLQHNSLGQRLQTMEWEVFCSQIKKEIRMSTKVQVVNNRLILTEDSGTITYEKYENILRRRVNNTGHEVLLQNISNVNFTQIPGAVNVAVRDFYGKDYIVNVFSFLYWIGVP